MLKNKILLAIEKIQAGDEAYKIEKAEEIEGLSYFALLKWVGRNFDADNQAELA